MSNLEESDEISRTAGKRKFLLTDEDLVDIPFKMKPNPINEGYAPMKVYNHRSLEKIAIKKHGSLEKIQLKQNQKSHELKTRIENKEEETRNLWDNDEIYEPMKQFMTSINLPTQKKSHSSKTNQGADQDNKETILIDDSGDLLNNEIILHYFDCMHHRAKGAGSYAIHKKFPKAAKVDQETPYNDRKKMGHFSWFITDSNQLVVILYVQHKFSKLPPNRPVTAPVINYDALHLALQRLYDLLQKKLKDETTKTSLSIGTYLPFKTDLTKFTEAYNKGFKMPVHLHTFDQE